MMDVSLSRRLVAEGLGTALLVAAVVGSGVMAERLAGGNMAIALLANTIATGAALVVLISIFGPVSGAHFNPAVTAVFALARETSMPVAFAYAVVQIMGAISGALAGHAMFAMPILEISTKLRAGLPQGFSEFVATFGLILTIMGALRFRASAAPTLIGLYIMAAYWFTASTSFANPAVTIGRAFSDSFAGISPISVPLFIVAQFAGAVVGGLFATWLFGDSKVLRRDTVAPIPSTE